MSNTALTVNVDSSLINPGLIMGWMSKATIVDSALRDDNRI